MKKIGIIKNIAYVVLVTALIAVAITVVAGRFGIGGVRALVVQSGSMEPAIRAKSVVFTAPSGGYAAGDVITFKQSGRDSVLVTHRVEGIEKTSSGILYTTKGDANEEADGEAVPGKDVVGEVLFSVPFIGAIISFVQTTPGFIALIIVPAVAIIFSEILNIKKELLSIYRDRRSRKADGRLGL